MSVKLGKVKMITTLNILLDIDMKMLWSGIRSIINVKLNVGISILSLNQNGVKGKGPKEWLTFLTVSLLILLIK